MLLSSFANRRQQDESDCLVACCAMVLDYLQVSIRYARLARILQTQWFGTPFGNVRLLESLGLNILIDYHGDLDVFLKYIETGLPVLVNVNTTGWDYWNGEDTDHAVVVVGIEPDREIIYVNDPFFEEAPQKLTLNEFEPGWVARRRQYAVIALDRFD